MQVKAKLSYLRISPRKVRLVADVIRGLDVVDAENQLVFMNRRAAKPMLKLLKSCIANAENNFKLNKNNLFISELRVDEGPTLKRWLPRAFGRASAINKRTSHIRIILSEKVATEAGKSKKEKDNKGKKINKQNKEDIKIIKDLEEIKSEGKGGELKENKTDNLNKAKQYLEKDGSKIVGGSPKKTFRRKAI